MEGRKRPNGISGTRAKSRQRKTRKKMRSPRTNKKKKKTRHPSAKNVNHNTVESVGREHEGADACGDRDAGEIHLWEKVKKYLATYPSRRGTATKTERMRPTSGRDPPVRLAETRRERRGGSKEPPYDRSPSCSKKG